MTKLKGLVAIICFLVAGTAFARNEHDDEFVDAMIMHHRHGIEMAQMAARKAQHEELRSMAQKMIDDQQREIRELESMRDSGEAPMRPELADMPGMVGMDMSWLEEKSGNDFDVAFLTAMIEHHWGAIRMSRDEVSRGSDPAVRRMARAIAEKQQRERQTMRSWKERWQ